MNIDKQLLHAAETGNLEKVKSLVASGANVNYRHYHSKFFKDDSGNTALIKAAGNGHSVIVEFLIENGADPYIENNMNETL